MSDWRDIKTPSDAGKFRYGKWAGNPDGRRFDPECCAAEVRHDSRSPLFIQCSRKPHHGPSGLFCFVHARKLLP